jgi:hypothetical protein
VDRPEGRKLDRRVACGGLSHGYRPQRHEGVSGSCCVSKRSEPGRHDEEASIHPGYRTTPGVRIDSIQPFKRDGHEQKPSATADDHIPQQAAATAPPGVAQGHLR